MIEQLKDSDKIQVQNFGLAEWLKDIQQAINEGYEFDFESNSGYPQQIGHIYTCQMMPRSVELSADTTVYLKPVLQETTPVIDFPPIVEPVEETKDALVIAPWQESVVAQEATTVAKQETEKVTTEVNQPAKRGPKPKQ
jgi:hypothetical protein